MPVALDTSRQDPIAVFNFMLDLGGTIKGYFTEVSGLGSESEVTEHKVVSEKGVEIVMKIPGRLKWENIVLKRGLTSSLDFWTWRAQVEKGDVKGARKDGSIVMFDRDLKEAARWNFSRGWPSKITGPSPKSDSNDLAVEELTIVHEYIVRVK